MTVETAGVLSYSLKLYSLGFRLPVRPPLFASFTTHIMRSNHQPKGLNMRNKLNDFKVKNED